MAVQVETHHEWDHAEQRTVFTVHFISRLDDSRCDSLDVLAYRLERVDQRTINADGVLIQFAGDIASIGSVT